MRFIRQLFCRHNYVNMKMTHINDYGKIVTPFKCDKCGKDKIEEYQHMDLH